MLLNYIRYEINLNIFEKHTIAFENTEIRTLTWDILDKAIHSRRVYVADLRSQIWAI